MNNGNLKTSILHLITPAKNVSPFDVNMAYDAGFDKIMPYTNVALADVTGLTQDAMFSRSAPGVKREAIFIGGRDVDLALQMLKSCQQAMFTPFSFSILADPSGAFTTAAAMIAKVEFHLKLQFNETLSGKIVSVFGATGPVGSCAAFIAAKSGAIVHLVAHKSLSELAQKVVAWNAQYEINLQAVDGTTETAKQAVVSSSDIVLCAAAAGVQILNETQLLNAPQLKIVADVNAVLPLGIQGVDVNSDGESILASQTYGIGALAIGQLKYATHQQLLKKILEVDKPQVLEFMAAFDLAKALVSNVR